MTRVVRPSSCELPGNSNCLVGCGKASVNSDMVEGWAAEPEQRQEHKTNTSDAGGKEGHRVLRTLVANAGDSGGF